jgi:hypothetical protein
MTEPHNFPKSLEPKLPEKRFFRVLLWVGTVSILGTVSCIPQDHFSSESDHRTTNGRGRVSTPEVSKFKKTEAATLARLLMDPRYQQMRAAGLHGQLATVTQLSRELAHTEWAAGDSNAAYCVALHPAYLMLYGLRDEETAIEFMDGVLEELALDSVRIEAGLLLANFFARAGQPNRAQAFADAWAETRENERPHVEYDHVQALLAMALGNPMSAIARLRKLHTGTSRCGVHANFDLAIAYETLAERDSAIAAFERHLSNQFGEERAMESFSVPYSLGRLGELYEWKAVSDDESTRETNLKHALAAYKRLLGLWAKADVAFNARINAIQERIKILAN